MISLRAWLDRFPSQVRLFVALLSTLSFVAPTWHVCSMGGHIMEGGNAMAMPMAFKHTPFEKSKSGALICFCAAKPHAEKPATPFQLNGRMSMNHDASCLALMLAAMPALLVSSSCWEVVTQVSFRAFCERRAFPTRQFIRTFCGRGPPMLEVASF